MIGKFGSPVVSVIIPTYNRAHLIGRAIRSVLDQTYQDWELIVVDDASTDDIPGIVKGFTDGRVKYIRHDENKGAAAARNTGIQAARGAYIAFLDSDDEWLPEKLERQVQAFESSDAQVGVIYTGTIAVSQSGEALSDYKAPRFRGYIFRDLLISNRIQECSTGKGWRNRVYGAVWRGVFTCGASRRFARGFSIASANGKQRAAESNKVLGRKHGMLGHQDL